MSTTAEVATSTMTNASQTQKDTQPPCYVKSIQYDRENRDYAMRLDGELVGFARNYHEAEIELDRLVFDLLSGQYFREAA